MGSLDWEFLLISWNSSNLLTQVNSFSCFPNSILNFCGNNYSYTSGVCHPWFARWYSFWWWAGQKPGANFPSCLGVVCWKTVSLEIRFYPHYRETPHWLTPILHVLTYMPFLWNFFWTFLTGRGVPDMASHSIWEFISHGTLDFIM